MIEPVMNCEIDPSNRCNVACDFCMYSSFRKESVCDLDFDIFVRLVRELSESGTRSVTLTGGGEPLMHPQFNEMVEVGLASGMKLGLITNGLFLDRVERKDAFSFIRVSLDAATRETYKCLKGKDVFSRVVRNIRSSVKDCSVVGVSFVVCEKNAGEVHQAAELASEMGVTYVQFKPKVKMSGLSFRLPSMPEGKHVVTTVRHVSDSRSCELACRVGIVGADGRVYYCCQYRGNPEYQLGSLKESGFYEIWARRDAVRPDLSVCPPCRYSNYNEGSSISQKLGHKDFL